MLEEVSRQSNKLIVFDYVFDYVFSTSVDHTLTCMFPFTFRCHSPHSQIPHREEGPAEDCIDAMLTRNFGAWALIGPGVDLCSFFINIIANEE